MDKDITCEQIEDGIREACDYVSDVTLFDVYEGVQLPPNKKSMAYSVVSVSYTHLKEHLLFADVLFVL